MQNRLKPGYLFGFGVEWRVGRLTYEVDALYFLKTSAYLSRGWDYEMGEISVPFMAKYKLFVSLDALSPGRGRGGLYLIAQAEAGAFRGR